MSSLVISRYRSRYDAELNIYIPETWTVWTTNTTKCATCSSALQHIYKLVSDYITHNSHKRIYSSSCLHKQLIGLYQMTCNIYILVKINQTTRAFLKNQKELHYKTWLLTSISIWQFSMNGWCAIGLFIYIFYIRGMSALQSFHNSINTFS